MRKNFNLMERESEINVLVLSGLSRSAGGLFYAVKSLCHELDASGCNLTVAGRLDEHSEEDLAAWKPVAVSAFKAIGPFQHCIGLRSEMQRLYPDLVHVHGVWLDSQKAAIQWHKKNKKPIVISPHGMLDPWALKNSAWKKRLVGMLFADESLQKATCIHALCRSEAESIRAYGLKNPVALIPNGVELPEPGKNTSPNGQKKLLFLGRIHPKKGIAELLDAWSKISSDWMLLIAGWDDGGHETPLKEKARELGLKNVKFIGPQFGKKKDQLLRSVDAFILPSFSEGLPMSVLEAWSYGLPAVITEFCNLPEGFEAKAAIRVEPVVESITQGLNELMNMTGEEREIMAANGRELVEQKFTWSKIAEEMKQVYEWCIAGGKAPKCVEFAE